ncbi:MAG: PepSY-like domain-containing protein [Maribacter sp.]|nr:PepSY-like domain-containing protein [Maribacter sp.]
MKNVKIITTTLLLIAVSGGLIAFGLKSEVPQKVMDAFTQKFPKAKSIQWDKESDTEWEAEFKMNGVEYSANFLEDGTWKETEHELAKKEIPADIYASLMKEFPLYKVEEAEISETEEGPVYEFAIEKGKTKMEVVVDMKGAIVKKELKGATEDKD